MAVSSIFPAPPNTIAAMALVPLPIDRTIPELLEVLRRSASAVLVAPPGAGKTTRVPPAMITAGLLSKEHPNLVMLQPRRVAARAAAARIADEQGWAVGNEVGYHVRFDRKISRNSRIRVLTEGILTRQLLDDPGLEGIGAVLLDEFHERSLHTDIAIALLREVQESLRPDLKLLVMSATLAAEPVAKFLGEAPIVRSEGRMFPITTRYRSVAMPAAVDEVPQALADLLADPQDDGGDVLVFLPGMEEIRRTQRRLEDGIPLTPSPGTPGEGGGEGRAATSQSPRGSAEPSPNPLPAYRARAFKTHAGDLLVLPLHGSLTADEQDLALRPSERRKIILATNIAETSLTIEGVTNVIDTGLARLASYDAERGLDRLDLSRISRASAEQRAGRAGRTAPGRCIRLWSEKEHHALAAYNEPEIRRVDLAGTALSLHAWGVNPRTFGWFEPPGESAINTAEELLEMLGAIERPIRGTGGSPVSAAEHGRAARATDESSSPRSTGYQPVSPAQDHGLVAHATETPARITPLGKRMVNLPMHPRLARLLVAAQDIGLGREGATLAAMLSEKDILPFQADRDARRANVTGDSDVLYRLQRLESGDRSLDHAAVRQVNAARHQFLQAIENRDRRETSAPPSADARSSPSPGTPGEGERRQSLRGVRAGAASSTQSRMGTEPSPNPLPAYRERAQDSTDDALLKLILLAYPDRVCKRRIDPTQAVMVGGGGVRIGTESIVSQAAFFVAIDARHDNYSRQQQAVVRIASRVEESWLEELFPQSIRREVTAEFDTARGKVIGMRRTLYRDLPLKEEIDAVVDDEAAARVLADVIRPRVATLLREDEHLAPLVARLELLAEHMPEHPWPEIKGTVPFISAVQKKGDITIFSDAVFACRAGLENSDVPFFEDWIVEACRGCRTIDDAKRRLAQALKNQLVYPLDRLLEQHAPETVEVPTGNRIKIDYKPGARPVLAVRLQEVFGWLDTPRIANGKVPLLMHLLGPNYRPVQITDDLRSFWGNTYFQVRKDLRVRYPKHSWPDDPLTATPQAKGRRRT